MNDVEPEKHELLQKLKHCRGMRWSLGNENDERDVERCGEMWRVRRDAERCRERCITETNDGNDDDRE